jgi:hypothetical protein
LKHIEAGAGSDFDLESATAFGAMMRQWERRVAVVDDKTSITLGDGDASAPAGSAA